MSASGVKPEDGIVALGSSENRVCKLALHLSESPFASRSYKGPLAPKKTPNGVSPPAGVPGGSAGFGTRTRGPRGRPAQGAGPAPALNRKEPGRTRD